MTFPREILQNNNNRIFNFRYRFDIRFRELKIMATKWTKRLTYLTIGLYFFMGGIEYGKHFFLNTNASETGIYDLKLLNLDLET